MTTELITEAWKVYEDAGHIPQGTMEHETQWRLFATLYNVTERLIEALEAEQRKNAEIETILKPEWTYGRVLPRYIGAEQDARLHAIRRVIEGDQE